MDRVIASPLLRARQTAEYIGSPVEIDDRWIEVDYGVYDGVELGTAGATELWERWRGDTAFVPLGGGAVVQMGERGAGGGLGLGEGAGPGGIAGVRSRGPVQGGGVGGA